MKKRFCFAPLFGFALLCVAMVLSGCGKDALHKAVKDAFIKGDTTEQAYQAICQIVTQNAEKYSEALDALGKGPGEEVHFSDSESTESNGSKKD